MGAGLKRTDLQSLAKGKLDDAILLLKHKRFNNAYYLAGYAVELGLKACIAVQITSETIPDKDLMRKILSHEFAVLVGLAGLKSQLKSDQNKDRNFAANWAIAAEWSPEYRYELIDPMSAQMLVRAISAPQSGVLEWIKSHW